MAMFRRNVGSFGDRVGLYKPTAIQRDELGGIKNREYELVAFIMCQKRNKTATSSQVVGDYVTVDTKYFLCRDFRKAYPITEKWRLVADNSTYIINRVTIIDDIKPSFLEIEATKLGGIV